MSIKNTWLWYDTDQMPRLQRTKYTLSPRPRRGPAPAQVVELAEGAPTEHQSVGQKVHFVCASLAQNR